MKKKVLLIYQPWGWGNYDNSLIHPMINELQEMGAKVTVLDLSNPPQFKNNYFPDKIENIIRRLIYKDIHYIKQVEIRHFGRFYTTKLKKLSQDNYDYTLVISPETYSKEFIKNLRSYSQNLIGYIWDGIYNDWITNLNRIKPFFDNIYCFNHEDISKFRDLNLKFTTDFYYDYNSGRENQHLDLYYSGGVFNNRRDKIIFDFALKLTSNFQISIFADAGYISDSELIKDNRVNYVHTHVPYLKTLEAASHSKILIDICRPEHKGLSFRFFEALSLKKKIITNNGDVVNYDFYRPENIMIVNFDESISQEIFNQFLESPYLDIPEQIVHKYSFKNWFNYLFGIRDSTPITYGK